MRRERASLTGSRTITANSVSDAEGKGSRWIYPLLRRSKKNPPDANEHPADQEWEEYQLIAKRRRSGTWKRSAKRGTTGSLTWKRRTEAATKGAAERTTEGATKRATEGIVGVHDSWGRTTRRTA